VKEELKRVKIAENLSKKTNFGEEAISLAASLNKDGTLLDSSQW
jgi:hypothetical protein